MTEGAKDSSLLFSEYRGSFPGVKRPGCDVERAPPSGTQVEKESTRTSLSPACLGYHG
jgi:hypothetical protein